MRVSPNPHRNSHYNPNSPVATVAILIILWPVWVFPLLMVIGSFSK